MNNEEQFRTDNSTRNREESVAPNYMRTGEMRPPQPNFTSRRDYPRTTRFDYSPGYDTTGLYSGLGAALVGIGAGITAMYFLDPSRGGRRRALVSDKFMSAANSLPEAVRVTAVDLSNRAKGTWSAATHLFSSDNAGDQVIEARVRSKMGRVVSHPHSIHVISRDGNITLEGVVLAREVPELMKCVMSVRGVKSVDNMLREYNSPEGIPSLQGGQPRKWRSEFMQQNWSPAARFVAGAAGISALTTALIRRDPVSLAFGTVGAFVLARSISNTEITRLAGIAGDRAAVTIDKSINVNAPPDVLFALWSNFENFPQFMTNVLEVRNINDTLSHWKVAGPVGVPVEWDAEITKIVPDEMIAWKSIEGSTIQNAGYVLFEPNDDGSTEVTVRLSYTPPAGALGHAIAKVFGADPKTEMDMDLMRMKSLLETGNLPHDAAQKIFEPPRGSHVH